MSGYYCRDCNALKPLFPDRGASPLRPPLRAPGPSDLGIPCLGTVPFDPELARRCDLGIPLAAAAETAVGRSVDEIAQRLLDTLDKEPSR